MNSNMLATLPVYTPFHAWGTLLAQWLKRTPDVFRANVTDMDSPYLRISVLTNKAGEVAYVGNAPDVEGEILFGALPLPLDVTPVFHVEMLTYGVVNSGTNLIKLSRAFESRQSFFVAGAIGGDEKLGDIFQTVMVWERERQKDAPEQYDGFMYVDSKVRFGDMSLALVNSAVDKAISRINSNKPSVDTRTVSWNGDKVTAYGRYKAQQAAEAKAKRDAKKAASA